jgi:hypothetical protein
MNHMTVTLLFSLIAHNDHGATVCRFDTIARCLTRNESSLVRK